ncbi:DUF7507 domain-containing protein [Xylanimonas sp. McL0601]|uniref:DUF7507 domain-containing protein n=1 Tax=Xylanimonas sp. McL0601 TaxID=3414739 RepID=UPI003CE7F282
MRVRKTIAAIAVMAAGVGVALEATAPPAGAEGQAGGSAPAGIPAVLMNESFRGAELHYDFTLLGQAGLTNASGGDHAPKVGTSTKHDQEGARRGAPPFNPDPQANPGYLQLTDNNHDKVGGVVYNHPLPTSGGLDVTFEMYQYNSTTTNTPHAADGIGFFISDGGVDLTAPGAYGGSLGYAQKSFEGVPGVAGGYLGIGFDVLGNYIQDGTEGRGYTNGKPGVRRSPTGQAWGQNVANTITLRGPGNGLNGYEYLTSTYKTITSPTETTAPLGPKQLGAPTVTTPELAKRLVRVTLSPELRPLVRVYVEFDPSADSVDEGDLVLAYRMPDDVRAMPSTFKFGFAGSTGDMTDVHLIRNLEVSTLVSPPAGLDLAKDVVVDPTTPAATLPSTYQVGDVVHYKFTATNSGQVTLTNVRISDRFKLDSISPGSYDSLAPGKSETFIGTYTIKESDVPADWDGTSAFELENVALAVSNETASPDDHAFVTVDPPDECDPAAPGCVEEPDPDPSDLPEAIPLPPVGGTPSALGIAGFSAAAALTAYLIVTRRMTGRRVP